VSDLALQWEDRNAIEQLIYCYSDAVTRADYVQMATVFADDAVWESPILGMHFETAREFIDFQADGSTALDVLIQTASNPVIDLLTGDRAARSWSHWAPSRVTSSPRDRSLDRSDALNTADLPIGCLRSPGESLAA
jgi:hypothetical protein